MACSFCYYGLVLMTTELFETSEVTCSERMKPSYNFDTCAADCRELQTTDYMDLLWTTLAEFPGIFFTIFIIERFGRKKTMAVQFVAYAVCCCLLTICTQRYPKINPKTMN